MRRLLLPATLLALLAAAPSLGQNPAPPAAGEDSRVSTAWILGLRLGAFEATNARDSWDAVFGEPMIELGGEAQLRVGRRLAILGALDYGTVDGERVDLTDPPTPNGIGVDRTHVTAHLTAAWDVSPAGPWHLLVGLGPTWVSWEEESTLRLEAGPVTLDASGSELGAHVALRGEREAGRLLTSLEVRYSTLPDALGGGVSEYFGEDDLGGLAVTLSAGWRLGAGRDEGERPRP